MNRKLSAAIVVVIIIASVFILVLLDASTRETQGSTAEFVIRDREQWFFARLEKCRIQGVAYEKEIESSSRFVKTIQIIQVDWFLDTGYTWLVNEGEWLKNGERIALSSAHDSSMNVNILDDDFLHGGLPELNYILRFGDTYDINVSFSFDVASYQNVSHAWKNHEIKLQLSIKH